MYVHTNVFTTFFKAAFDENSSSFLLFVHIWRANCLFIPFWRQLSLCTFGASCLWVTLALTFQIFVTNLFIFGVSWLSIPLALIFFMYLWRVCLCFLWFRLYLCRLSLPLAYIVFVRQLTCTLAPASLCTFDASYHCVTFFQAGFLYLWCQLPLEIFLAPGFCLPLAPAVFMYLLVLSLGVVGASCFLCIFDACASVIVYLWHKLSLYTFGASCTCVHLVPTVWHKRSLCTSSAAVSYT